MLGLMIDVLLALLCGLALVPIALLVVLVVIAVRLQRQIRVLEEQLEILRKQWERPGEP